MTNEIQETPITEPKSSPFGARLKSAREALGLERKDAAAQLRLNEKVITMMEKDRYPDDLPVTFIRGYIRAYGKLLQIPDLEIKKAIEPIVPKIPANEGVPLIKPMLIEPVTSSNSLVQVFTYLIVLTIVGLVGIWWYNRAPTTLIPMPEPRVNSTPNTNIAQPPVNTSQIQPPPNAMPNPPQAVESNTLNPAPMSMTPAIPPKVEEPANTIQVPPEVSQPSAINNNQPEVRELPKQTHAAKKIQRDSLNSHEGAESPELSNNEFEGAEPPTGAGAE